MSCENNKKKSVGREIFEWAYSIVIAVVIAFIIKGFLFDVVRVDGLSMYPNYDDNDRLIVTKLGYTPHQGDAIVLDSNYKKREAHFEALAEREGKEELSWVRKTKERLTGSGDMRRVFYIKRVIATEGQTVDIRDGKVYIDGNEYSEPYISQETYITDASVVYPFTVSEDCVFVMGDNRGNSKDSRSSDLGEVPKSAILGKANFRIFPFNKIGTVK